MSEEYEAEYQDDAGTDVAVERIPQVDLAKFLNKRDIPTVMHLEQNGRGELVSVERPINNVADDFWGYLEKSISHTNWENEDLPYLQIDFESAKLDFLMSMDEQDYDWNSRFQLQQINPQVRANIRKGVGMKWMILETASIGIRENLSKIMNKATSKPKGLVGRLFGRG